MEQVEIVELLQPKLEPDSDDCTTSTSYENAPKKKPLKRLAKGEAKKTSRIAIGEQVKKTSTEKQNLILQKKNIVFNVYTFFKSLSGKPGKVRSLNFNQAQRLTANACGISLATVKRVTRMYCASERIDDDIEDDENITVLTDGEAIENVKCDSSDDD